MKYSSTRNKACREESAGAILTGMAPDGGLFVPEEFPKFSLDEIKKMGEMTYADLAACVLERWLTDYSGEELKKYCREAYSAERFESTEAAPLRALPGRTYVLELWHGPTCAFKDFALQMLPRLLPAAAAKCGEEKKVAILVATSGDTGKAALAGFADVAGTCIGVFYPDGGVSDIQRLQMVTQSGKNVAVFAVKGNFDDAQSGVKAIFADRQLAEQLEKEGIMLSSANSINWGRLAPQIVYYFSAYARLLKSGAIKAGDPVDFCVPTGNFGNILAGYLAQKSGLPVRHLVCASNQNNVLADFMASGVYDKNRAFFQTTSPSMDILISSNLERLLFLLSGRDDGKCRAWMEELRQDGRYQIGADMLNALHAEGFAGGWADEEQTAEEIARIFRAEGYLCDTHTAVAMYVQRKWREQQGGDVPMVVLSTASPFKFAPSILKALGAEEGRDGFDSLDRLSQLSGLPVPPSLAGLRTEPIRFNTTCSKDHMSASVMEWLEKEAKR